MDVLKNLIEITNTEAKVMVEVGVNAPDLCRLKHYGNAKRILVEPLPRHAEALRKEFPDAIVHQVAISKHMGTLDFIAHNQISRLKQQSLSPASFKQSQQSQKDSVIKVDAMPFSNIDPGNIDVLLVDIEGGEWEVLQTMISFPRIIVLEMHSDRILHHGLYRNPNHGLIQMWMKTMGYAMIRRGDCDCWWVRDVDKF